MAPRAELSELLPEWFGRRPRVPSSPRVMYSAHHPPRRWLIVLVVGVICSALVLHRAVVVQGAPWQKGFHRVLSGTSSIASRPWSFSDFASSSSPNSYYGDHGETAYDPWAARDGRPLMSDKERFGDTKWSNYPADDRDLKAWEFSRALVHAGSGARVQRFLDKAESGQGFVVSVVGGSVSKGRGLRWPSSLWQEYLQPERTVDDEGNVNIIGRRQARDLPGIAGAQFPVDSNITVTRNLYNPLNLHTRIFDYLNATYPAKPLRASSLIDDYEYADGPAAEYDEADPEEMAEQNMYGNRPQKRNTRRRWTPSAWFKTSSSGGSASRHGPYRGRNIFVNGAQGGVGSDYFAGCWKEHVPVDSDLVLVELGINDLRDIRVMESYEMLLRSLLEMPSKPAIINIQTFTLLFPQLSQASSLHVDVGAYYDTPVIGLRDVLLPRILNDHRSHGVIDDRQKRGEDRQKRENDGAEEGDEVRKWFRNVKNAASTDTKVVGGVDLMHISASGHALMAEMVIHYLQQQRQQLAITRKRGTLLDFEDGGTDVPLMLLAGAYEPGKDLKRTNPFCRSTNTAVDDRKLEIPPGTVGWSTWSWGEKRYIVSDKPGSTISFPFHVSAAAAGPQPDEPQGIVQIAYQRSWSYRLGSVKCWVDDDTERGVRVDGWWQITERNPAVISVIRDDLPQGEHELHCELLNDTADPSGGKEFRLIAVMHG